MPIIPNPSGQSVPMRLKSAVRTVLEAAPPLLSLCKAGKPNHVLRFDGGIGDEFLCTAIIRELKRRGAGNIWMQTDYPELFRHNTDVTFTPRKNCRGVRRFFEVLKMPPTRLSYAAHAGGRDIPPDKHVITALCEGLKISGRVTKRPYLYLQSEEKARGVFGPRQLSIQSSGLSAKYAAHTKEWYPDRFQQVVNGYRRAYTIVQVGSSRDPLLDGVVDMRGKTSIRETAGILINSDVFIGLAGFLQHLARSVECRSVIIYGGRELPSQTGYTCNENLVNNPECSPCWIYKDCEHGVKCMDAIGVGEVVQAIERQLGRKGEPLVEDSEECGVGG